jgi:catechol 2,3-dioxygenase-like lactoylglutathione lyase family enzyme
MTNPQANRTRFWTAATFAPGLAMLAVMWLASTTRAQAIEQTAPTTRPAIEGLARIAMTVEDADRSIDFYTRILSFEKISDSELGGEAFERLQGVFGARARVVQLRLGAEELELVQYLTPPGREIPRDSRSNDRWFQHIAIITSDMDRAYAILRENKVRYASSAPQRLPDWNRNAAGIRAFYFRDPDDHVLEILQFPPDKGLAKWHATDRLFLGIDHTAIVVCQTDASVAFYRNLLGMRIVGESENYGPEQEHLNNVFGAHLRITTLRAASGPGVELLEYLSPRDGRPYPADARANDLFNWETVMISDQSMRLYQAARVQHRDIVTAESADSDVAPAFVLRDPDGHAVEIQSNAGNLP